ncbi:MAG: oligosaccharide flippase family protein [Brevundimonas sp.]|uniref:lipopolysaccharide biosynthesis protein n=1 Tax=Brevundimonas sp. TaxID=1871086 RepID=UPI0027327F12|nr:oligosaccharide flippase family protein [Brevundimonas sp.]MDP3655585.1 oligosaccharide flippase family protein [Brevundimonas sp.]MDZ4110654.1 oligosaccharide flippase family protein [Brevundimonas sp.]
MSDPIADGEISTATGPMETLPSPAPAKAGRRRGGSFASNIKWQLVGSLSQAFLGGVVLLLMGRELGAAGFGVYSIIMGVVYLANALVEPRMQDVAAKQFWNLQADDVDLPEQNRYFLDLLALETLGKLLPCVAVIGLAHVLTAVSNLPPGSPDLFVVAAAGYYLSKFGYGLSTGLLRVLGRSDLFALCTTGEVLIRFALMVGIVLTSSLSVEACIWIVAMSGVASNGLQWWLLRRHMPMKFRSEGWTVRGAARRTRLNMRLLVSNLGMSLTDLMNKDLDVTLISTLLPAAQVGIYKMAKNITLLAWRAIDPFYIALMPEISRMVAQAEFSKLSRLIARTSAALFGLALFLSVAAYVSLLLFGDVILGPAFTDTAHLLPWMMVGIVLSAPLVWGHPLAVALNCADVAFLGSLLGAVVGLAAFMGLVPLYGVRGASLAWVVSFVLSFVSIALITHGRLRQRVRVAA